MIATSLGSPIRATSRLLLYGAVTVPMMVVQVIAVALRLPLHKRLPLWYHRQCCWILGFRIERRGRQSRVHPTLYVANHASYFDIMVLGSLVMVYNLWRTARGDIRTEAGVAQPAPAGA